MLIENSIHSIASNIPPNLLVQLAKVGIWSYPRCIFTIRENSNSVSQAESLKLVAPDLPPLLLSEALEVASEIKDDLSRANALVALMPHINKEQQAEALPELFAATKKIKDDSVRASTLTSIIPHLNDELKAQVLVAALAAAREIKDEYKRASALAFMFPHLNDELKVQTLTAVREIKDESARAGTLSNLAPLLNKELKVQALQEALAAAREIKDEYKRASALSDLAPNLDNHIQISVLSDLFYLQDANTYSLGIAFKTWEEIEFKGLKENIIPFIHFIAQKDRKKGMEVVQLLTPALVHFRGPDITAELFRAIVDTARWWP
jgi:hypothetical protein